MYVLVPSSSMCDKAMDRARVKLYKEADSEDEVHWEDIRKKARVKEAHRTTVAMSFKREGIPVSRRPPREKPLRGPEHEKEREVYCAGKAKIVKSDKHHFLKKHMFLDNKTWPVPTTARARRFLKTRRVRFHLRTPSEGLKKGFTKPSGKKHAMNTGAKLKLMAGIAGCRVVLWEYFDSNWTAEVAANMYRGPVKRALVRNFGKKRRYRIVEDNDPTGYKSQAALDAKTDMGIEAEAFPRYSPDLNPLDYFLWEEVQNRMDAKEPAKIESVGDFKRRLRKTAMSIPKAVIRKGILDLNRRVKACAANKGCHIPRD